MDKTKIQGKFYPLTPELGEKLRQSKLTAAEWRLWSYLVEIDSWGDTYRDLPDTLEIMEKVDIKKSTFYAAIAKFQELELFDFQDKGFSVRNLQCPKKRKPVQDPGNNSENLETIPKTRKVVRKNGNFSEISEKQEPEALQNKDFIASQNIKTNKDSEDTTEEKNCCVLSKFEDRLKVYGIHLYIFDEKSEIKNLAGYGISINPKIIPIREIIEGMPEERAERAIAAFLAWLPNAKNIRCKYAAFATSLRETWEV